MRPLSLRVTCPNASLSTSQFPVEVPTWAGLAVPEAGPSESAVPKSVMLAGGIWLLLILAGSLWMAHYSQTAGSAGTPPERWPETSLVRRDPERPQLLMFLHPRCACSRATLGELELLMAHCQGLVSVQVLFIQPEGVTEDWVKTDLWRSAAAIPGVNVSVDHEGGEALRFRTATSGQALLYDLKGRLIFQGGITLARAHSGDNPGRSALEGLLRHQAGTLASTPVFGCALSEKEARDECTPCQP